MGLKEVVGDAVTLSSIATTVVTYYFGSSEGSARKNELFQEMKEKL